jgi:hypothetical protein
LRGLSALTAEAQVELTDALSVIAFLASQDDVFQYLADGVHGSILLAVRKLGAGRDSVEQHKIGGREDCRRFGWGFGSGCSVTKKIFCVDV